MIPLPRLPMLSVLLLAGSSCAADGSGEHTSSHVIEIRGFEYHPREFAVLPGDTIVWVNRDAVPHSVTVAGAWDSGAIGSGEFWVLVAEGSGTTEYYCAFHPTMRGTLALE